MNRTIQLLAALLGVQIVLAAGLAFYRSDVFAHVDPKPLLSFTKDQVNRLTLEGPDQAKLELAKVDGKWQLAGADEFPADASKVDQLLSRLADLKHTAPVATSSGSLERLKVAEKSFERKITLADGDKALGTLYLGTSPGVRTIHARTGDRNDVYAVALASYDVPVRRDDWEDKAILQVPRDRIAAIEANGVRVERVKAGDASATSGSGDDASKSGAGDAAASGDASKPESSGTSGTTAPRWQIASGDAKGSDAPGADRLAELIGQLRFDRVLGRDEKPEYNLKSPALTLAVTRDDGTKIEYRIGKTKDDYVLKASTRPEYFRLPSYTATPLIEAAERGKLAGTKSDTAKS